MNNEDRVGLVLGIVWLALVRWLLSGNHVTTVRILVGSTIVLALIGAWTMNPPSNPTNTRSRLRNDGFLQRQLD